VYIPQDDTEISKESDNFDEFLNKIEHEVASDTQD
jgi:hypothetical protein